jgi:Zn-dependent M28 family amino/carboxypeptidase
MTVRTKITSRLLLWTPIAIFSGLVTTCAYRTVGMPGSSHTGPLPAPNEKERALARALRNDVTELAATIGERRLGHGTSLDDARRYIETELARASFQPTLETYEVRGTKVSNVVAELSGKTRELVVIGAHYDSVEGAPGANDNASGVAMLLALARELAGKKHEKTLRFIAFANEEQPYIESGEMGSQHSAALSKKRGERVTAMLSLETLGYYSDAEKSQKYPFPLSAAYPSRGNFVAFVGNSASRDLVRTSVAAFRETVAFPSEGGALPENTPGVGWSDHASYWRIGVPAVMVTDTAFLRYPHYHLPSDTPDKLDYERLARIATGLLGVVRKLARGD